MRRTSLAPLLLLAAACIPPRSPVEPIRAPEELVRATPGTSAQVIAAAPAVFAGLSLAPAPAEPGANLVMSHRAVVQGTWPPAFVGQRLVCGAPFPRRPNPQSTRWIPEREVFDLRGAIAWTQTLPVLVRVGIESVDRVGGSTTRLIVEAHAERPMITPNYPPRIACLPTQEFVEEVFRMLEAAME